MSSFFASAFTLTTSRELAAAAVNNLSVDPERSVLLALAAFNELLVPLQAKDIDTNSRQGFEAMDKSLKARVETTQ